MTETIEKVAADFDALMARKRSATPTELRALTARIASSMTAAASQHAAVMATAIADYKSKMADSAARSRAADDRLNEAVTEFLRG